MLSAVLSVQENPCKVIPVDRKFRFEQMVSTEKTAVIDETESKAIDKLKPGMANFPKEIYNKMIAYSLENKCYRNAMFMVCMANWGMRFSDVSRVRYGHIFNENGEFRESFTLPNGEKKTGKSVIYYNNKAVREIISLYLRQPENSHKTRLDYLFTSESGNSKRASLQEVEAADLYNSKINSIEKTLEKIPDKQTKILEKYTLGKISETDYEVLINKTELEFIDLKNQLAEITKQKAEYTSPTPGADKIYIQLPITHTAAEDIIKDTLKKIGINPKNQKNKQDERTTDAKYNTHSLRKTFSDWFMETGQRLVTSGELCFNDTVLELLKNKFQHSSLSVTAHYTDAQESAFKTICLNMNIGMEAINKYFYGG